MAEDKLKQMFGLEEKKFKFDKNMRKGSEEDDEYYDRTIEIVAGPTPEEADRLRTAAKDKSYIELKNKLAYLMSEKQEINDSMMSMVQAGKSMGPLVGSLNQAEDDLEKEMRDNEKIVRDAQKKANIQRMIKTTAEIDE